MSRYWLMKSEPDTFGIEHLKKEGETAWEGVRNFTARNYMIEMRVGDTVLFYHSSCSVPGVYGLAKVTRLAAPDKTQFDTKSAYYDRRATKAEPYWYCVNVTYVRTLKKPVTLEAMRKDKALANMRILEPGSRLSVTPVTRVEYAHILKK